jgi:hypothetical protein
MNETWNSQQNAECRMPLQAWELLSLEQHTADCSLGASTCRGIDEMKLTIELAAWAVPWRAPLSILPFHRGPLVLPSCLTTRLSNNRTACTSPSLEGPKDLCMARPSICHLMPIVVARSTTKHLGFNVATNVCTLA